MIGEVDFQSESRALIEQNTVTNVDKKLILAEILTDTGIQHSANG